jgi:hypothetical protein
MTRKAQEAERELADTRAAAALVNADAALVTPQDPAAHLTCVICDDKPRRHVLQPCGHVCLCDTCVLVLLPPQQAHGVAASASASARKKTVQCPICRAEVKSSSLVYL